MKTIIRFLILASLALTQISIAQWMQTSAGLSNSWVSCFAVSDRNLYAGTHSYSGASPSGGVFLSANDGANWTSVNNGLPNNYFDAIAVSGSNVFAGTWGGVFRSTDNGTRWTEVDSGLPHSIVNALITSGPNIFVGCYGGPGGRDVGGVYLSTNNGTSWTAVDAGLKNTDVAALAIGGSNLFVATSDGVFRSTNNGTSWVGGDSGLTAGNFSSLEISGSNIFVGTSGGVFLSTDNATSWAAVNTGLTNTDVRTLAVSGTNIFAGTSGGGIFLSTDNGASWKPVNSGLNEPYIDALAVFGTHLFAGSWGYGVWRRPLSEMATGVDRPMSLEEIQNTLLNNPPNSGDVIRREESLLALDGVLTSESDSARISPSIINFYTSMMNKVNDELKDSVGKGVSIWMMYNDGFIVKTPTVTFAFDLLNGYYGWNTQLPPQLLQSINVLFISHWHNDHFDPAVSNAIIKNGGYVVVPSESCYMGNIAMSAGDDLGLLGLHIRADDAHHGTCPTRIFGVTTADGTRIVHTGDNGTSATLAGIGYVDVLLLDAWVNESGAATSIVGMRNCLTRAEPKVMIPGHIYELEHDNIVSNRLSYEWALDVDDLPLNSKVQVMAWGERYKTGDRGTSSIGTQSPAVAKSYQLWQNYPNPFNPQTNIQFSIANFGLVKLVVYDLLGREVATVVNEMKQAGKHSVQWDASRLTSGVYFYTITAGAYRETKRMILMK